MKILFFTSIPFPEIDTYPNARLYKGGGWMFELGYALSKLASVELAVVSVINEPSWYKKKIGNITFYAVPEEKKKTYELIFYPSLGLLENCRKIAADFKPDVVHMHGIEHFYGLLSARHLINFPTLISIQGLFSECAKNYFGGLTFRELLKCHSFFSFITGKGLFFQKILFKLHTQMEREIILGNYYFTGRTLWDKAHIHQLNPKAHYYHCDELLRPPFYLKVWEYNRVSKYSIFCNISCFYPFKGFHWLLRALALVRRNFPEVTLRVAGPLQKQPTRTSYESYLSGLIDSLGLQKHVSMLGTLTAEEITEELTKAHVFVVSSMMENSSNALAEGMLVGTPCIASLAGGITTMIDDRKTALGYPAGDVAMLSECIQQIFSDPELAQKLSIAARQKAQERHNKEIIIKSIIEIYKNVIVSWKS